MAQVNIEEIIDHLDSDLRRALHDTLRHEFPDLEFDESRVFRQFVLQVGLKCSNWEWVPDQYVSAE